MGVGGQRHTAAALTPGETRYPLSWRLGGLHGRSGRVRKISPIPGFDPRTVQPVVSRYTDWAVYILLYSNVHMSIPAAVRSKAWGPAARLLGLRVRILPRGWTSVFYECCVLSSRCLCVGLITRPEDSFRVWCVWVWLSSLDIEEALIRQGLLCHGGKNNVRILHDSPLHSASVCKLFYFICVGKVDTRPVQDLLASPPSVHNYPPATRLIDQDNRVMRRLATGILSEKWTVRRFCRCAKVLECTYTNLESIAYYTPSLYGIAYSSWATNLYSMLLYWIL